MDAVYRTALKASVDGWVDGREVVWVHVRDDGRPQSLAVVSILNAAV